MVGRVGCCVKKVTEMDMLRALLAREQRGHKSAKPDTLLSDLKAYWGTNRYAIMDQGRKLMRKLERDGAVVRTYQTYALTDKGRTRVQGYAVELRMSGMTLVEVADCVRGERVSPGGTCALIDSGDRMFLLPLLREHFEELMQKTPSVENGIEVVLVLQVKPRA